MIKLFSSLRPQFLLLFKTVHILYKVISIKDTISIQFSFDGYKLFVRYKTSYNMFRPSERPSAGNSKDKVRRRKHVPCIKAVVSSRQYCKLCSSWCSGKECTQTSCYLKMSYGFTVHEGMHSIYAHDERKVFVVSILKGFPTAQHIICNSII
jgi:hypothetical protein